MAFELKKKHVISKYCLKHLLEMDSYSRRTTRYVLQSYLALRIMATEVDGRVFVPDFLRYRLYKFMRDDLNMGVYSIGDGVEHAMSKQSVYAAYDRLIALGLVSELNDPEYGHICALPMEFLGFQPAAGDFTDAMKGFVRIPQFLISQDYLSLTLRDQKAMLYILQRLYNENDTKNINFLSRSERRTSPEGETELERIMRICRINRFAHLKQIMDKLRAFFSIEEIHSPTTKKTFRFAILDKFRLPGKHPVTDPDQPAAEINRTIHSTLTKLIDYYAENAHYTAEAITKMAKAISSYDYTTQKAAVDRFLRQLKAGNKPANAPGYLRSIAESIQTA